jgi:glycine/D-amino acid oxidase-like deaminating enzyme
LAARDAIVIGGGIAGCSAAGFLAAEGLSVTLLERRQVAACQSGLNAGWIRSLGRTRAELPLIQVAMELWREWASSLDLPLTIGGGYSVSGDEAGLARLLKWKQLADPLLPGVSLVECPPGRDLSFLRGAWSGALHRADDGHCEPVAAMRAIAGWARSHGVEILEQVPVTRLLVGNGAVRGVGTAAGDLEAPLVICAAGAWSSRLLRTAGVRLPVQILRSTLLRTQPVAPITTACVTTPAGALRQGRDGSLVIASGVRADVDLTLESFLFLPWFSASRRHASGKVTIHPSFLGRELLGLRTPRTWPVAGPWPDVAKPNYQRSGAALTAFSEILGIPLMAAEGGVWAGYVDLTPDANPVIGPAGSVRGLHIASGFSGHGFGVGPGAGLLAAQLALGHDPVVDPQPFALARMARRSGLRTPEEMLI